MTGDGENGEGFKPLNPNAKSELVTEKVQAQLENTGSAEKPKGILGVLLEKFSSMTNYLKLDFLKKRSQKGASNHILEYDADDDPVQGQSLMQSPDVSRYLGSRVQKKVGT